MELVSAHVCSSGTYKKPPKGGVPLTERTDVENLSKSQLKKLRRKLKKIADQSTEEGDAAKPIESGTEAAQAVDATEQRSTEEPRAAETVERGDAQASEIPQPKEERTQVEEEEDIDETPREVDHHVKIVDFGNSCWVHKQFTDDVQTRQYRSPEVILGMKYSTPIDIWSAACVAFELATGDFLFDPKESSHVSRDEDHLALMAELLGEFPQRMKTSGKKWHHFFDRQGRFRHVSTLKFWPLEDVLHEKYRYDPEEARMFASFLTPMLAIDPQQRATARQCLEHPFLAGAQQFKEDSAADMPQPPVDHYKSLTETNGMLPTAQ